MSSEAGSPGKGSHTNNDHDDKTQFSSVLSMEIADGRAQVVIIHRAGWKLTFFTDIEPPTGVWRDIEDVSRWIASRYAA
ncbi:MAG TPA: hypothetical protein VND88_04110 [Candidatus Acidoferrales bacterium]|nr:hypothetical protein [Candidatus Acidoferrales bacterium]